MRVPCPGELLYEDEDDGGNNRVLGVSDLRYLREMTKQRVLLMGGYAGGAVIRVEMLDVIERAGGGGGGGEVAYRWDSCPPMIHTRN